MALKTISPEGVVSLQVRGQLVVVLEPPERRPREDEVREPAPALLLEVGDRSDEHDVVAGAVGVDDREARLVARPAEPPDDDLVLERRAGDALDHWSMHGGGSS